MLFFFILFFQASGNTECVLTLEAPEFQRILERDDDPAPIYEEGYTLPVLEFNLYPETDPTPTPDDF